MSGVRTVAVKAGRGDEQAHHDHRRPAWGKLVLIVLAIAALSALWRFTPLSEWLAPQRVFEWARGFGERWWAPIAVMAAYTPACFVMFPRPLITLFSVVAFGPWLGFTYGMSGILIASAATYYAGRALPEDTMRRLAGSKMDAVSEVLRRRGLAAVFAVRIVPVAPFSVEGMIAGAAGIPMWQFMLGTFLGMLPGTLTTTVFGDQIETALEDPGQINKWLITAVVVFFVVLILVVRRWFAKEHREGAN